MLDEVGRLTRGQGTGLLLFVNRRQLNVSDDVLSTPLLNGFGQWVTLI